MELNKFIKIQLLEQRNSATLRKIVLTDINSLEKIRQRGYEDVVIGSFDKPIKLAFLNVKPFYNPEFSLIPYAEYTNTLAPKELTDEEEESIKPKTKLQRESKNNYKLIGNYINSLASVLDSLNKVKINNIEDIKGELEIAPRYKELYNIINWDRTRIIPYPSY